MRSEINARFVDAFNDYLERITIDGYMQTSNLRTIEKILNEFSDTNRYQVNFHRERIGWMTFGSCKLEGEILELEWSEAWTQLFKPRLLEAFYFFQKPDFSFMRLSYEGLEPTGLYPAGERETEEYVRDGEILVPRKYFDEGIRGYDEDGKEIPLSEGARSEEREIKDGNFLIVSKGSILNETRFDSTKAKSDLIKRGKDSKLYQEILCQIEKEVKNS